MDEKEIKDTTDSIDNLPEENNDDNLVEVIENKKIDDIEEPQQQNNNYPSSTNKLTAVVYLVIFISILIWVYFYVTQNKDMLDKLLDKDETSTWQIETLTWETDNTTTTNTDTESGILNTENTENTNLNEDLAPNKSEKDPISTTSTNSSWTSNQNDDAIIKDFENELDSLFNMIDENAK